MLDELLTITGRVTLELLDEHGCLKDFREIDNIVTTVGKNLIANRMLAAPSVNAISHMGVGTGATAPAVGDTVMTAEIWRKPLVSATVAGAVMTHTGQFLPGEGTGALQEAGLFNASAAGVMLARTTYAVINKASGDTLNVTWTVTIA
jgi:hypothetical protein